MALTINSNTASLTAQQLHARNQTAVNQVLAQLSSGSRLNSVADNPADLAIATALGSQISGDQQALNNTISASALTQTAAGALSQVQANTQQIQQLALQASNGTLTDSNRQALQQQVDQLTQANSQILQSTQFNGTPLFTGNQSFTFQVGANGQPSNQLSIKTGGLDNTPVNGGLNSYNANLNATQTINISSQSSAQAATSLMTQDLNTLSQAQTKLGAASNSLATSFANLQTRTLNDQAAKSRISDTDYAAVTARLAQGQILSEANLASLTQANLSQSAALTLLR